MLSSTLCFALECVACIRVSARKTDFLTSVGTDVNRAHASTAPHTAVKCFWHDWPIVSELLGLL